jgi:hypothetical protein
VRTLNVKFSGLNPQIVELVRGYDLKTQPVQIYRPLFNPVTRFIVGPPKCRFAGFVDGAPIVTPTEAEDTTDSSITLALVSHTRDLTRSNSDVASDQSQRARSATDNFLQDVGVVGSWEMFWGENKGIVTTAAASSNPWLRSKTTVAR